MKRILSFGGGLQTTALAIMVAKGELEVDEVVFADTGAEKPETYGYIENYIKPMLIEADIPFSTVKGIVRKIDNLYEYLWDIKNIPTMQKRWCSDQFKYQPIRKHIGNEAIMVVGFSFDEAHRANKKVHQKGKIFPLIETQITGQDCHHIIVEYGLPTPIKSSCFFCPFQHPYEWNWLKNNHYDLFLKAIELERRLYERKPKLEGSIGLLRNTPLWKMQKGLQPEMFSMGEDTCWSGHCGH